MDKMNIVSVVSTKPLSRREAAAAKFEKLWSIDPEQFDPTRNCLERERLKRTEELFPKELFRVADLGCGSGYFSRKLRDTGAKVDAVDIAKSALDPLREEKDIKPILDYVPRTSLPDDTYDLVICTELIAYLPEDECRLLFSELARILKPTGKLICSTPLDYTSEGPLERFASLAETEFDIEKWKLSYHLFYLRLKTFFETPGRFVKASQDPDYRQRQLDLRKGLSRGWFRLNSDPLPSYLWKCVNWIFTPAVSLIRQNKGLMLTIERFCRLIWSNSGITHAIFLAKRRTLEPITKEERPVEMKHKKQVWE